MRVLIGLLICLVMTACATHPRAIAARPVITRIAIIPAANPV